MIDGHINSEMGTAEAIVAALTEGGVKYVLGMPGGLTGPIWRALYEHPTIRAVQAREESIAAIMAEAYGRMTGEPAVVMGQGEWIVGNAGQGYMEALMGSSPLLILTEMSDAGGVAQHAPYQAGTGDYGTWDARTALEGVSKRVMVSHDPVQAVQHTQLAIKHATTGEPGPVAVIYAHRALDGTVGPDSRPVVYPTSKYLQQFRAAVDEQAIQGTVDAIRAARRPILLAGNGVRVSGARAELMALAAAIDAPVVTTASGKGVFDETDPRAGGVIGRFGWPSANRLVAAADLIVAVGTKLSPSDVQGVINPAAQTIVQIDVEPLNVGWTTPVDLQVIGDAAHQLRVISAALGSLAPSVETSAADRAAEAFAATKDSGPPAVTDEGALLDPRVTIGALVDALPGNAVIACDAGENRLFMMRWFRSRKGGEYLQPAAGGGMGYAVPAAMGAKLADPSRTVVAVCGDGGFAMSIHALMTALQENLPIAVVVLNNQALGWVLHGMGEHVVAANFAAFDYGAIARATGCDGVRVTSAGELRDALKGVTELERPMVIDVATPLTLSFRDIEQPL